MARDTKHKTYKLEQSAFFRLRSLRRLRTLLRVTDAQLSWLTERDTRSLYTEWDDLSKPNKPRHIEDPKPPLKRVQRRIAQLFARVEPPDFLYCPVKGRSFIQNAASHRLSRMVRKIDVSSYFTSTTGKKVFAFFEDRLECARDISGILTRLTTANGHLPTGAPSSPLLAYYAHKPMWEGIRELAVASQCVVSLYMDDLTISGQTVPGETFWKIKQLVFKNGLRYHKEMTYVDGAKEITGVVIRNGKLLPPNRSQKTAHQVRTEIKRGTGNQKQLVAKLKGREAQHVQIAKANQS